MVLIGTAFPGGRALYYYSIWIFQQVNQRMRLELIERLQAQSLVFHAGARTGDAIYRVYQNSAMVTGIVRSILLEPLMFIGRYLLGVVVVAAFDPFLALVLGLTVPPILYLGYRFSGPLRRRFRHARETNSALTSWIQESVLGIRVIKACHAEAPRTADFAGHSRAALDAAFRSRVSLTVFGILAFGVVGLAILAAETIAALRSNADAATFAQWILVGYGYAVWNYGSFYMATARANEGLGSIRALISTWVCVRSPSRPSAGKSPWRRRRTSFFSASVLDNIRFANPDATPAQVAAAAQVACADTFVEALPDGY